MITMIMGIPNISCVLTMCQLIYKSAWMVSLNPYDNSENVVSYQPLRVRKWLKEMK